MTAVIDNEDMEGSAVGIASEFEDDVCQPQCLHDQLYLDGNCDVNYHRQQCLCQKPLLGVTNKQADCNACAYNEISHECVPNLEAPRYHVVGGDKNDGKEMSENMNVERMRLKTSQDLFNGTIRDEDGFKKSNAEFETVALDDTEQFFDDLDRGWAWVVLVATFFTFALLGNGMYAVGILHSALLERFRASVSLTSWAGSLHGSLYFLGGPLSTAVIDRFSCRTAMVLSGLFFILGDLATAFAPTIEVAIFTFGIVAGIGGSFGYTASMVVIGFYFKRRRNLAIGIAISGVGAGIFALSPVTQFARDYYGTMGAFIFTAGMMAHVVLFGVVCCPSKLENHILLQRKRTEKNAKNGNVWHKIRVNLQQYSGVICNKGILCLCLAMFLFCLGTYLLILHLQTYILSKGFSYIQASMFLSLIGLVNIPARVVTGIVADHVHPCVIYAGSFAIVAIAMFVYPFVAAHFAGQVAFMVVYGALFGSGYVVTASMSLLFIDIKFLAAAIGLQFLLGGIGSTIGPVLAGLIVDNGGSYDQSVFIAAFCTLLAALCGGVSTCFVKPKISTTLHVTYEPTKV